ncbi:hypothetical protein [Streptomyces griseosporeus]|uniref:hypothetical protein n=1 Tax=Streptomyces griseosporeus TaxID=1910 RepID=UPI003701852B
MRTRTAACTALLALALLTAGCSSDTDDKAAEPSATPTATSASPTPSPAPSRPLAIGDTLTNTGKVEGKTFKTTVTVLGYTHDFKAQASAADETGAEGYVWSALEVKVCALTSEVMTSRFPWTLAYADGARVEPSGTTYDDFPKPEYPIEARVNSGDCIRGKIAYAVPGNQRPEKVIYAPESLDESVEWSLAKQ